MQDVPSAYGIGVTIAVKFNCLANAVQVPVSEEKFNAENYTTLLLANEPKLQNTRTLSHFILIGSLLSYALCTRSKIVYVVHCAKSRSHAPTVANLKMPKLRLRYFSGNVNLKLIIHHESIATSK